MIIRLKITRDSDNSYPTDSVDLKLIPSESPEVEIRLSDDDREVWVRLEELEAAVRAMQHLGGVK